jgi:rod shape-determining protein MreD
MKTFWTALAIVVALLLETMLSRLLPGQARVFDPFLIVLVYCALVGGETQGMLAGLASGWVQDVHFGGPVLGLSALAKLVVGFTVGVAAGHFLLVGPGARALVLLVATIGDAVIFQWLASVFDLPVADLTPMALLSRSTVNAALGTALFELIDRRWPRTLSE